MKKWWRRFRILHTLQSSLFWQRNRIYMRIWVLFFYKNVTRLLDPLVSIQQWSTGTCSRMLAMRKPMKGTIACCAAPKEQVSITMVDAVDNGLSVPSAFFPRACENSPSFCEYNRADTYGVAFIVPYFAFYSWVNRWCRLYDDDDNFELNAKAVLRFPDYERRDR